jgi:hypothetical protein
MNTSTFHDQDFMTSFFETLSFCSLVKAENAFIQTTLCEPTNSAMLILYVLKNGVKNGVTTVLSTMSSIHKMSFILAQFQLCTKSIKNFI